MINLLLLIMIYLVELILRLAGLSIYLLLLVPYLIFLQKCSISQLLIWAALSGILMEQIHGLVPGSVLLGIGLGLIVLRAVEYYLEWRSYLVQLVFLTVYLVIVFSVRMLLLRIFYGQLFVLGPQLWLVSWGVGVLLVVMNRLLNHHQGSAGRFL